jgi:hypothetical protein
LVKVYQIEKCCDVTTEMVKISILVTSIFSGASHFELNVAHMTGSSSNERTPGKRLLLARAEKLLSARVAYIPVPT